MNIKGIHAPVVILRYREEQKVKRQEGKSVIYRRLPVNENKND